MMNIHEPFTPPSLQIEYPKPDGKLTFDLLSGVALTGTNHEGDQGQIIDDIRIREKRGLREYVVREVA